ncbi:MAG: alpha/beta hydrolase [Luteitalea sp.]|nr:alpha/beta hydrolase [Luteitalea sp.]
MSLSIDGPAGRLEALIEAPRGRVRAAVVLAASHPDIGGTMQNKVLHVAAKTLVDMGCVVLRFNYRGVGLSGGPWVEGHGARDDYRAALDWLETRHRGAPFWAVGYSFGSWVAMTTGAKDDRVVALVGIGLAAESYDYAVLTDSEKAKFLIHGDHDSISPLRAVQRLYARIPEPRELVVIEGADHAFDGHVLDVGDTLGDLLADF